MKFYEIKQQTNNHNWLSLGFVRKKKDAEKYEQLYNTKTMIYPTKIVEHEFKNPSDIKEELKESQKMP
jgi:hypothetical protein